MPYQNMWYHEQRIIRTVFSGMVTADDFRNQLVEVFAMFKDGVAPVHIVLDITQVRRMAITLPELRELARQYPNGEALGWVMIVGDSLEARFLMGMGVQFRQAHARHFPTMDEALAFLGRHDDSLSAIAGA